MSASPLIDRRNLDFVLYDLLDAESLTGYPRFSEHTRETFSAAVDLAHQVALEKFLPHNRKGDLNEPQLVDGKVVLIPEIAEAVQAFNEAGFAAVLADYADGGMQLPFLIASACDALFAAAGNGTLAYPLLARAAANLLAAHGSPEQQRRYMKPIIEGRYFGTMCLSEPQAGSSLADIKTTATPHADGSYRLTGAKMWISAGDHELGENIVHLVLAKIVGAPAGVRGISLFIVPRYRVNADGSRGARNDVVLAGLNHKMGNRGSVNTFLKFGESGDCHAELVGEAHEGLAYMFHMMNEERIGVGMGAVMQGQAGYLYSLGYAKERRQGRHPDQRDPTTPMLPIIEHPDVRRMLLQQKCWVEGAFALGLFAASLVDRAHDDDRAQRRDASKLLDLLTPIVKSWSSEYCLRANELAIQVLGGYGYTREFPVEQCYRDNRINAIHEGSNGIQALDLLGRKVLGDGAAALALLGTRIERCCVEAAEFESLRDFSAQLRKSLALVASTTQSLAAQAERGDLRVALGNAQHYMVLLGHTTIAWIWLWQALCAERATQAGRYDADFLAGKRQACRFFFATDLPTIENAAQLLQQCDRSAFDMQPDWF